MLKTRRCILDRHSSVTLVVTQCFKNITLSLFSFVGSKGYKVRKKCRTLRDWIMTFWNEIILDKIIENHILKSRELRVNITSALCTPARTGYSYTVP
jgi:hypothetical protein